MLRPTFFINGSFFEISSSDISWSICRIGSRAWSRSRAGSWVWERVWSRSLAGGRSRMRARSWAGARFRF